MNDVALNADGDKNTPLGVAESTPPCHLPCYRQSGWGGHKPLEILPKNAVFINRRNTPLNTHAKKTVRVEDVACLLEKIAPAHLAEDWDNCGLQVGSMGWEIKKIWVALDPLLAVIEAAIRNNVDLVITHHPLIFDGVKRIDIETIVGKTIAAAVANRTAIYSAHTNLDSAAGGINDLMATKIGLHHLTPMVGAKPAAGGHETTCDAGVGMGRIGHLAQPKTVLQWIDDIKKCFGLQKVRVAGNVEQVVRQAAVCSGSGGSLVEIFLKSDAQVFVTGDLRYHDARAVEDAGRAFIDIGHFASEHIILDALVRNLTSAAESSGWDVQIESCMTEKDPFELL
jgi:dinuclear metal center YbgI/SA1388 family protein